MRRLAPVVATLLLSTSSHLALAQSATPGTVIELDPLIVSTSDASTDLAALRKRMDAIPGGVALVNVNAIGPTANLTLSRALESVPGVVVQNFFGGNDQPRLQIRGSGSQQNPVERGVLILQDGLPLNRADGSYIVGFADPQQASAIEVFKGYTANRLGATVLGGALNFISPTGVSAPGTTVGLSAGSFGQFNVNGRTGFSNEKMNGLVQADFTTRTGFREYNDSQRTSVGANVGFELSENVKTRIFAGYRDLSFDVAGPLPWVALQMNPKQVWNGPVVTPKGAVLPGPNVTRDRPKREAKQFLVGSRTTATFGSHVLDGTIGYTYTDDMFRFPISSGVRTTKGGDLTLSGRYAYQPDENRPLPLFEASVLYTGGSAERGNYLNIEGVQGAQFGDSELGASTLSFYTGVNLPVGEMFTLSPALSYAYATRKNTDNWLLPTRPTAAFSPARPYMKLPNGAVPTQSTSFNYNYDGWSPSIALNFKPNESNSFYVAISHSFEPPTWEDLLATVNGTPNSSPGRPNPGNPRLAAAAFVTPDLDAQTANTIEGGWRGEFGNVVWDASTYYSWVDNELLNLRDATGASLGAMNAGKTRHFGVEVGVTARLWERLVARLAYTYQDFRFHDDPVRGNNELAGIPPHFITLALQYSMTDKWMVMGSFRWSAAPTPVDNMNTLYSPAWIVTDVRTEYNFTENFSVFGEITNLFNEVYAGSTLIVDQARKDQAAFLPGDGRGFFAGVKATF